MYRHDRILCALLIVILCQIALSADDQTISGFIKDETNGESLIGVNVYIKGTSLGATSNKSGYYIISGVPTGGVTVIVSYMGYEKQAFPLTMKPDEPRVLNVALKPEVLMG